MRTNATTARAPIGDVHHRPAKSCTYEAIGSARAVEARLIARDARRLREHRIRAALRSLLLRAGRTAGTAEPLAIACRPETAFGQRPGIMA